MFNIILDYPTYEEELEVVKRTTGDCVQQVQPIIKAEEIIEFQGLVKKVPVVDNVIEYAVNLVNKTRPNTERSSQVTQTYLEWGAGPRASQNLIMAAKCNAILNGKYSPDIEDVQAVAHAILRHRVIRNFKAEAEGVSLEEIISKLL